MEQHGAIEDSEGRGSREGGRKGVLVFVPSAEPEFRPGWHAVLESLRRDRRIHVAIIVGCCAVGAALAFLPTKIYRAQAVLLPVSLAEASGMSAGVPQSSLSSLVGLAGINLDENDDFRKRSLALLTSKDFTARFIQEENLLPLLYASKWDAAAERWRVSAGEAPTIDDALEMFERGVRTVSPDRRSGLTTVTIEWRDRTLAAQWANELVARANSELRRRTIEDSEKKLGFLNHKLAETSVMEIQQTLYRLMESELRKITLASVSQEYAFRVIDAARIPMAKRPVRPRPVLALLLALSGALMLSAWLAWVRANVRARAEPTRRA
jgi:uncharacterized protein involved in exopolysaccharide biosynthesis